MADLLYSPASFADVDLFSEWESSLGWEIRSTQLSRGEVRVDFDHVALPELLVSHFRMKGRMQNTFAIPEGMVVLVICRAKLPFTWVGREFPSSLMGICRAPSEQWAVIPDGWDCYEFIATEELIRRTEIFPPKFFAQTARFEDAYLPMAEPETGQFLRRMDSFFQQLRHTKGRSHEAVRKAVFFNFLVNGLQRVCDAGLAAQGFPPRPTRRADIIPIAKELMRAHLASDLTADEMAQSLGVSYRVLNYAFRDAFGVSPYRYFLAEKLHAVRRKLKASDVSITEACLSYGFSTPSRFARQYQRLFGELPSETRQKIGRRR